MGNPLKILYVVHDFLPRHSAGTEVYTAQLALRVRERGHEVRIFATEKDISRPHTRLDSREWEGLEVSELVNNLFYKNFEETWDWPPSVEAFGRLCDEFQPDVIHVMHLLYQSIGVVEEAVRRGIPVVYTLHDFWLQCARFGQRIHADGSVCHTIEHTRCGSCLATLKFSQTGMQRRVAKVVAGVRSSSGLDLGPFVRRLSEKSSPAKIGSPEEPYRYDQDLAAQRTRQAAARERDFLTRVVPAVARFFAPSAFLRNAFVDWGIPPERIEHLTYGLEQAPFKDFQRKAADKVRVRYLGTLAPHKAPHLVLEAWGRLPESLRAQGNLVIHGPKESQPAYVGTLEKLAKSVGASLPGAVDRDRIAAVLEDTDLLVVPSIWYENSPLTIHEARSTRTPLLVSDLGGMAELVQPECDGWRFQAGDAGALAQRLEAVLRDPGCLGRLSFEGPPVKAMSTSAEEMEARYREVCATATGGAAR